MMFNHYPVKSPSHMWNVCDICRKPSRGLTIFNAMSGSPPEDWVKLCTACSSEHPCPTARWESGLVVCRHMRRWKTRVYWDDDRAVIEWIALSLPWYVRLLMWFGFLRCK